jgi:hypothetical protein
MTLCRCRFPCGVRLASVLKNLGRRLAGRWRKVRASSSIDANSRKSSTPGAAPARSSEVGLRATLLWRDRVFGVRGAQKVYESQRYLAKVKGG